ncbi:hypothetical protein C1645_801922 [Glomus cerebriforme]|uniref:Response regulatory domain-containing protein n=1 Tax=Glomus cerebriforme TaxID=658196 RepID=A0A397TJX8_9GLOM|nr:hypothetical protein C1645_801922 [Glomus cerebriforme]
MAKETQSKKDTIHCNGNNIQLSQDTGIPLTPPISTNAKATKVLKTENSTESNEIKNINKDKNSLQDDASSLISRNNNISQNESSESSEDEEYETPSKEPYEDKYIKLTTIDALDFLTDTDKPDAIFSDGVLSVIRKTTYLVLVFYLLFSVLAVLFSRSLEFFDLSKFYALCSLIWVYYLYRLNSSSLSLKETINAAKKIASGIAVIQSIYLFIRIANNVEADLVGRNPLLPLLFSVMNIIFLVFLDEFFSAYQKENCIKQALLKEERDNSQQSVYKAIDRFSERKGVYLRTISAQLRQTTDMAMDTLRQLSPPHFLSKPREQLSACSISFPTASINAIHNVLKDINYISTHLGTLSLLLFSEQNNQETSQIKREFDIGEIIQHVGDVLAGDACNAKVELVIYHVEYGLNHLNVIGDEAAFRHSLLDLLKCIIDGASPGDCVELGLQIRSSGESESHGSLSEKERTINPGDKVTCTIEITHNAGVIGPKESKRNNIFPNANLTHKILSFLGAKLKVGDGLEITIDLEAGSPIAPPNAPNIIDRRYPHSRITGEPSIEELIKTSQNMRGQRVALHATSKSYFAKHITSCLTTWGTDISHVPIGGEDEFETPCSETTSPLEPETNPLLDVASEKHKNHDEQSLNANLPPTFIIIDDDIDTLKQQLTQLRKAPFQLNAMTARPKRQGQAPNLSSQTIAVIHFTSLANYKSVKDAVQYIISPATGSFSLPQVLVIPKPAGPRRFLTALHTTINRIVVDPVYMPIATSPMSPGQQLSNGMGNNGMDPNTNPLDSVGSAKVTESPGNYFSNMYHSSAQVGSTRQNTNNSSPLSPRSGPGGGLLVIPKNNLSSRNSDGQGKMIKSVGSNSPGRNGTPFQNNGPLSPVEAGKGARTQTNGSSSAAIGTSSSCNPIQSVSSPPPPSPSMQNQPPAQQPRVSNKHSTKTRSKNKTNADTVIPPVNVLIVEDNPINQAILSTFMKKKKIKYECASNGQEAVDKWQKGGFHLVLMDIQLPVMDGIEATKKIRSLEKSQKIGAFPSTPSSSTPTSASSSVSSTPISTPMIQTPPSTPDLGLIPVIIVALTASSLSSDRTNALAAGCNDFLTKPVSLVWLERKIQEWGCMQALIDFDGWRRWKRDGEEAKKEKRESITNTVCPAGNKSKASELGESKIKLSKHLKHETSENNNNDNMTKSSIKTTISRSTSLTNSFDNEVNTSTNQKDTLQRPLSSTISSPKSESIKVSPVGVVSSTQSPPPIVIKPSTPQSNRESVTEPNTESNKTNNISPKICPISAANNMKNNLISNNSLTITTNSPISSTVTNESTSQPSTPLSVSAPQKVVRKRGNTVSSITGVNMNVDDKNGNSLK